MNSLRSFLYALARLLGDVRAVETGRVGRRVARRVAGRVVGRCFAKVFRCAMPLFLLFSAPGASLGGERADFFDSRGNRQGYAVIDPGTGTVDTYDKDSNRTGYGRRDPSTGGFEFFDLRGRRQPTQPPPRPGRGRR